MALDVEKLHKPARKLRRLLKSFPKQPSPEQVHDLRTRTRRIEAMLEALMLTSQSNERRLLLELAPLRKKAGKVRDMDVLTGFTATLEPDETEGCLIRLLEHLGAVRDRQCRKLRGLVQRDKRSIRRRSKQLSKFIDERMRAPQRQSNAGSEWSSDAMAVAFDLSKQLNRWPALNASNLHDFRFKVKQLLYILQLADEPDMNLVKRLGELKDAIGEWHDWQELAAVAVKVLDHRRECKVVQQIRATVRQKFDQALAMANETRKQYLREPSQRPRPAGRRDGQRVAGTPIVSSLSSLAA